LFNGKNISFGKKDAKVVFVEISDPSCPFCQVAGGKNPSVNKQTGLVLVADGGTYVAPVPEMKKLVDAGKASFVWIYANGHGNGEMGAKALYCANDKKKFWEVSDLLMSEAGYNLLNGTVKNDKTKSGELADFLNSAVSASDMKSCLDSGKYDSRIAEDTATSAKLGMSGTPKFFVNTEAFKGAYSFKDMQASVDKYLK
jgi:protein-disulfide isomerase